MRKLSAFISELRRRRVFRVAAVYAGIAFVVIQIIDGTFAVMGIPDWISRLIIILLLIGFPISIGLAWAFDITDEGIVRTKGKADATTTTRPFIGNTALGIIASLAIIVAVWSWWGRPAPAGPITSIAVLPLDNLMGDPDQDYFVDGMHEAIISNLSRIGALKVISRTSTMRYRNTTKGVPQIASELGVGAVVEGSVLKVKDRVRITAQLIHGLTDEHLWVEDYERDLQDILTLQGEVARDIARQIDVVLSPVEEARLEAAQPTVNPEAYTAFLQGHHILWERLDWHSARPLLETAIALEPGYAPPYADLASVYIAFWYSSDVTFDQAMTKAQELIERAIFLDHQLPTAYISLGIVRTVQARWREADEAFRKAVAIAPNSREANVEYGWFLLRAGKADQAVGYMELGLQLDPLSFHSHRSTAMALHSQRRYDQTLEVITRGQKLDPENPGLKKIAGLTYLQMGKYEEAIEIFGTWDQVPSHLKGLIHVARGERGQALQLIEDINSLEPGEKTWGDYNALIMIYAALGEVDLAMDYLERFYRIENQRLRLWDWGIGYLKVGPAYDPLRSHPRFQALLKDLYGE